MKYLTFVDYNQYLKFEKPSGVEVEISVHKTLAMDFLKGGPLQDPPLGLIGLNALMELYQLSYYLFTCPA